MVERATDNNINNYTSVTYICIYMYRQTNDSCGRRRGTAGVRAVAGGGVASGAAFQRGGRGERSRYPPSAARRRPALAPAAPAAAARRRLELRAGLLSDRAEENSTLERDTLRKPSSSRRQRAPLVRLRVLRTIRAVGAVGGGGRLAGTGRGRVALAAQGGKRAAPRRRRRCARAARVTAF